MRTRTLALLTALLVAAAGNTALAAAKANPNRGKSLFKASCKACHTTGGEAKLLTPLSKTQAQWQKFFKSGTPACVKRVAAKGGKALLPQDLADMEAFLVAHAADSDQPETCGQ